MELKLQVQQKGHATSKTKNKLLLKVYLHFVVNWRLVKEKTKQELVSTGALSNNNFLMLFVCRLFKHSTTRDAISMHKGNFKVQYLPLEVLCPWRSLVNLSCKRLLN